MIRQFKPEDSGECCRLYRSCIEQDGSLQQPLRDELLRTESPETMAERARLFYIAVHETEGRIAGLGGIDLNEIRLLFVAPENRGRGIGRQLLQHLEEMAPRALFRNIFVYATPGAAGFYQAHGYAPGGEHVFRVGRHDLHTLFMSKNRNRGRYPIFPK